METIKPCPFCGSIIVSVNRSKLFWVFCRNCNADGLSVVTEAEAIESWNNRPIEDRLRGVIRDIISSLKSCKIKDIEAAIEAAEREAS
jgi:Lar family restriction alleviation protein